MDYEKSYREALERAKNCLKDYTITNTAKSYIEEIFPELKESEDERIRKALIKVFSNREKYLIDQSFGDITVSEAIAWLKNQGNKQNQISIWKHWKNGVAGNGEGKPIYLIKNWDTYSLSSCLSFECDYIELSELDKLMLEKQGEKLPIGFYYVNSEGKKFYSDTFKYGDIILHVEKQGERIYWKPSEEQMQTLHAQLNEGAETYPEDKRVLDTLYEDLTKIMTQEEKQGEQKPAGKVEPKFKVKYADSEYNVFETKDVVGVTFYGIEDEPNHIDYVKAESCEIIGGYTIKENGSPYPTKPATFSGHNSSDELEKKSE